MAAGRSSLTPPSPGTPAFNEYDGQGFLLRTIANYDNGFAAGPAALDDLSTSYTYDAFGRTTSTIGNAGIDLGPATKTTVDAYDLLGNPTSSSTWSLHTLVSGGQGTFSGQRQTSAYHEIVNGIARPGLSGTRGPGALVPSGSPAPLCPDGGSLYCNIVSSLDLDGRAIATIDPYGKVGKSFRDVGGRVVFNVPNWSDGAYDPAAPDVDLRATTRYDILGRPAEQYDPLGRSTTTGYDALGRVIVVRSVDSNGTAISKVKTTYTPGGRVDRTSAPGADGDTDAQLAWTKTVYDDAGRATKTIQNWDLSGYAGLSVDSFEATTDDETLADDGVAEYWSAAAGGPFTVAGGSITRETGVSEAQSGSARLRLNGNVAGGGTEWHLDGTFRGTGVVYKARVWIDAPSGLGVSARLGSSTSDASSVGSITGTGNWQQINLTWDPTADRTDVRLAVYVPSASGSAVYIDNAVVWNDGSPNLNIPIETAYDAAGRVIASVLPPGVPGDDEPMVSRTAYDGISRVTSVTSAEIAGTTADDANLDTETTYDGLGRTSTVLDPTDTVSHYIYDRLGRVTSTVLNEIADGNGVPASSMADDDVTSTFAYDAAGELIQYCPAVQVFTTCTIPSGAETKAWHYAYDDAGHLVTQRAPDNQAITDLARRMWTYDAGGRLTNVCDDPDTSCGGTNGRHSGPTYDGVGRPTAVTTYTTAGGTTVALKTATTYLGDGAVTKTEYYEGATLKDTIDQTYDTLGRPDQVKRSSTILTDYAWNPDGTLASRQDGPTSGGIGTTTFGYDWADRLISANLPDGFSTAIPTFAWRADGLIKSRSFDTGAALFFSYDRAKRLTKIDKGSDWLEQVYDRDGNVVEEDRSLGFSGDAGADDQDFTYDGLNRVTGSTGLTISRSYTYDLNGNRKSKTVGSTTTTYGYDRTDQLSSINASVFTATHTIYGDLTSKRDDDGSITSYQYDLGGKLTKIDRTNDAQDATFSFDALGRFNTRALGPVTPTSIETYSYLGTSEAVSRIDSTVAANDIDSMVDAMGNRLGIDGGATMNWFVPDPHGNVAASLSSDEATVTNATRYDAWGETVTTGNEGGTAVGAVHFKYQGRLDISHPNLEPLYDMSARFYSPNLGAFSQLDSVMGSAQNPLSMNRYLYAHANPATLIDPTGHVAEENDGPSQSVTQKINASEYLQRKFADETQRFVSYKAKAKLGETKRVQAYQAKQRAIKAKIAAKVAVRKVEVDFVDMTGREAKPDRGGLHTVLDFAGMIPVVGIVADVANSGLYAMEGDYVNAGMSALGAIPLLGDGLAAGRMAVKYGDDALALASKAGDDVAGALGKQGDELGGALSCPVRNSFAAGTPVAVEGDKSVPIEEIEVGDEVEAWDEASGEVQPRTITAVIIGYDGTTGTVEIDGERISTTAGHPFYTTERGWVDAADLRSGDHVPSADGSVGVVGEISWDGGPATMFNLTVEIAHTYFVGDGEWLVHNCGETISKRFTADQDALIQIAKDLKNRGTPISRQVAGILGEWGAEYGLRGHPPLFHPRFPQHGEHINVGPVKHIPVDQ